MERIRTTTQTDYVLPRSAESPERRLRRKIVLLAIIPLMIACLTIAVSIQQQGHALARAQASAVAPVLKAIKEAELRNYTELARGAIAPRRATRFRLRCAQGWGWSWRVAHEPTTPY